MPLTELQRSALPLVRAYVRSALPSFGTAESVDERARLPDPASIPTDLTVRVDIASPSPNLPPLLDGIPLRAQERVPLYFYALKNDQPEPDVADTHVILFIHGGGNVTGHPTHPPFVHLYAQLLRAIASQSGDAAGKYVLVAPSYRLATVPENAFPAALQDVVTAYDHVLDKGYKASNIVLAGDSAGGNLAVVLTHLVLHSDRSPPPPCGVIAIGPAAIWAHDRMSEYAKAQADNDILDVSKTDMLASMYVGDSGVAPTDPLVSGAYVPFDNSWPKTLILVGNADQLIDSSRELERRLADIERPVELVEYDERPHGWWALAEIFPDDIHDAAERIANFVLH